MSEPRKYYLGGTWESSAETVTIRNPFDDSAVEDCSLASAKDANTAVEKAGKGFGASRKLSSAERFEILSGISESIRKEREQFASLMTSEVGKAISLSRGEVDRAVMTFRLAAEEAKRISGEVLPLDLHASSAGRFGVVRRFPIGVVLAISPFNYPLNLVAHKVGPAIASGNAWILKPPPQAPGTSLELARIIEESGFPKEAFSVLPCRNEVAESLVTDDRINMLSFTGSAAVGWNLKSKAGKKKILLELGGNAGVIVDESARIAEAARRNAMGAFVYSGQVCIKVQRIFIHQNVFDRYVEAFLNETKRIVAGDPRKEETMVGPLIDEASASRVLLWVEEARKAGATLLNGGARSGRVIEPTVLLQWRFVGNAPFPRVCLRPSNHYVLLRIVGVLLDGDFSPHFHLLARACILDHPRVSQQNLQFLNAPFHESLFVFGGVVLGVGVDPHFSTIFQGFA